MDSRPELTKDVSAEDFLAFYWLKKELTDFCRAHSIPTGSSKVEITKRIATFLATGEIVKPQRKPARKKALMPETFTRETVIGEGWRSSQPLRYWFEQEIGTSFRFNGVMRDFVSNAGVGKTLGDAIDVWHADQNNPQKKPITGQFEYNRFTRAYYAEHQNATREEVIAAWQAHRAKRKPPNTPIAGSQE